MGGVGGDLVAGAVDGAAVDAAAGEDGGVAIGPVVAAGGKPVSIPVFTSASRGVLLVRSRFERELPTWVVHYQRALQKDIQSD